MEYKNKYNNAAGKPGIDFCFPKAIICMFKFFHYNLMKFEF